MIPATATCIAPRCPNHREVGALFCGLHMKATAVQRGGWISAEKRRRTMSATASKEAPMDLSNVANRLWVGARPPFDRDLPEFDVLVLCAQEIQPKTLAFGREVVRAPLPDAALTNYQIRTALQGATQVAKALRSGRRVLVTCAAGLNRSALVAALGLGMITRMTPAELITLMRERRSQNALFNPHFCELIQRFVGQRPRS